MLLVESFLLLLLKEQSESDFNPREFSSFRHAKWGSMSNIKEWISRQHKEEEATELSSYKYLKFNASWYQLILRPSWSPTLRTVASFRNSFSIPHFSNLTPKNFSVKFLKLTTKRRKNLMTLVVTVFAYILNSDYLCFQFFIMQLNEATTHLRKNFKRPLGLPHQRQQQRIFVCSLKCAKNHAKQRHSFCTISL